MLKMVGVSVLNVGLLHFCFKSISQSLLPLKLCPKSVKCDLTPKSLRPTHNYPKMPVAGNLPQNITILETFDDKETLKWYQLKGLEVLPTPNFPLSIPLFSLTSWARSNGCFCDQFGFFFKVCMSYY